MFCETWFLKRPARLAKVLTSYKSDYDLYLIYFESDVSKAATIR